MSAKKIASPQSKSNISQRVSQWFSGLMGMVILCLVLLGIFIVCAFAAWQKIGPRVLASPEYVIGPRGIEITPPPPWLRRTDLAAEVYRDLTLHGPVSIMDDDLTQRVAAACLLQPWVAKVQQVAKQYPAKVKVDLVYRRPVCMVKLGDQLLPVDAEAVLLPADDFCPVEMAKYPRLLDVDRGPMGGAGRRWGDIRVAGGAEIAAAIQPIWEKLKLQSIVPHLTPATATGASLPPGSARRAGDYYFEIIAAGGMRIIWGRSPASDITGEPTPLQKVKKLEQFFAEHGSLDYPQAPRELDLRKP
ncbi:MAG: hypothetical protein ABSA26_11350 [Thermoguttaceae bacterium]